MTHPALPAVTHPACKVLFVNTATQPPLGAETWVHLQIMRSIDRRRHEVHVACALGRTADPTPTYRVVREIADLHVHPVDFGQELSHGGSRVAMARELAATVPALVSLLRLAWTIRRLGIEVLHTSDRPRDAVACVVLAKLTRSKSIIHIHVMHGAWTGRALRWAMRHADALIGISEFITETLVRIGHDAQRVHTVLNSIDPDAWESASGRADARRELAIAPEAPVVLSVCRLFPEKGPAELIRACAAVRRDIPELRLVIVGFDVTPTQHFQADLDDLVDSLGMGDVVRFLGRRDDIPQLMAAADVYAMPSFEEPFGLVFLEAMATKLPVVALDSGGAPEIVEHGRSGLLSLPGDAEALAANLTTLLTDPELRREMGRAGRDIVNSRFTTDRMAQDVADVYERVVAGRAPADVEATNVERKVGMAGSAMETLVSPTDVSECRRRLEEDGYVVFRNVVSTDRLAELGAALVDEYDRARQNGQLFNGGGSLSGHLNCFPGRQSSFVYDDLKKAGIIDLVGTLRPDIVDSVRATLNFNLPGSVAQHYHADGLYTEEFLICNVAVVDTDLVNGAIDVLPGTQKEFHPFWRYALRRQYRRTTRVPMQRGDAIVRKSTLWHRGMPNNSALPRPMMAVTFGELGAPVEDPFGLNDGAPYFFPNWYNTSRLGQLRERTFVTAPTLYSAYRFARSLYGNKGYSSW